VPGSLLAQTCYPVITIRPVYYLTTGSHFCPIWTRYASKTVDTPGLTDERSAFPGILRSNDPASGASRGALPRLRGRLAMEVTEWPKILVGRGSRRTERLERREVVYRVTARRVFRSSRAGQSL
jgi:hypothetical protein